VFVVARNVAGERTMEHRTCSEPSFSPSISLAVRDLIILYQRFL